MSARLPQLRIGGAKIPQQLSDRRIGEPAAIVDIFHMAMAACIELVKQRVAFAVEDQLPDAESFAQLRVERGRDLEQPFTEPKRDVAVVNEKVSSHKIRKLRRIQMIADIGETDRRRNSGSAQRSG